MGETFAHLTSTGPLLVAIGVAALAGLASFLSPCVLPLVPGYVSFVAGMAGADLDAALGTDPHGRPVAAAVAPVAATTTACGATAGAVADGGMTGAVAGGAVTDDVAVLTRRAVRGRILLGSLLFIAGFTAVFVAVSVIFAGFGKLMVSHARALEIVGGLLIIVLGLGFAGLLPGLRGEARIHALPRAGLVGAPVLGAVFALSWTPCVGPTLGAVVTLGAVSGQTSRAVILAVAYCLGLGLPFLAFGLGFRRLLGVFAAIRRHSVWVTRIGGALLVIVGLALVTGGWGDFLNWLRATVGAGTVSI